MTKYRAVCFDLGETLIHYKGVLLSWLPLHKDALEQMAKACDYRINDEEIEKAKAVLEIYNTRIIPRVKEVSADQIMGEILAVLKLPRETYLESAKKSFFSFFQRKIITYEDAVPLLQFLNSKDLRVGIFTDVPYGMDKSYVENDLKDIHKYIDCLVTSRDAGYRKPDPRGYIYLAKQLGIAPDETIFVGNEEKDILGANAAGLFSVLIDRENTNKTYDEKLKISSLMELQTLFNKN